MMMSRALWFIACLIILVSTASAADLIPLHVYTQVETRALPFYVGIEKGFFARHGLKVELEFTQSSANQRDALASGKADILYSAVDNAVAMVEVDKKDVIIVTGGDSGTNEFYVQDYVKNLSVKPNKRSFVRLLIMLASQLAKLSPSHLSCAARYLSPPLPKCFCLYTKIFVSH